MTANDKSQPRPITIEDVHKLIGAMTLELEMLRRENAQLKAMLETQAEKVAP